MIRSRDYIFPPPHHGQNSKNQTRGAKRKWWSEPEQQGEARGQALELLRQEQQADVLSPRPNNPTLGTKTGPLKWLFVPE